jgi:Ca2+/H+ antiporter, TMEM165/GDT1 family
MFKPNHHTDMRKRRPLLFLLFPVLFFGFVGIVMLLWNAILPQVLGVSAISYWQAMGILVLSRILFGGNGGMGGKHNKPNFRGGPMNNWREKWQGMTEEEKAQFKENWRQRCDPRERRNPQEPKEPKEPRDE